MVIYVDRKVWASMALRRGPNVVGPFGLLQSFADGLKVFLQETIIPTAANKGLFLIAPIITTVALLAWAVIPFNSGAILANINVGLLYILAISSLGIYGIVIAGWSSNSKYPFFSAMRASAQMISYEVSIGFILVCVVLCGRIRSTSTPSSRRRRASVSASSTASGAARCCSRCG
jgi:NADH-quinone oxidoreductase subunit H